MESNLYQKKYLKYNKKINIINGISAIIAFSLVNPYFAKFAQRIGATDYQIAYLNSLPALVSIFALIPGAFLIERLRSKKNTTTFILFSFKIFYLFLAFVPLLDNNIQPVVFVLLVGLMNFPGSIYNMSYQSCIGDIFSPEDRSYAMGLRNRYSELSKLFITFLAGQMLKIIPSNNHQTIMLYQLFFILAFVVSMIEVLSFSRFKFDYTNTYKKSNIICDLKETVKSSFNNKEYLSFVIASLVFHFGWQMGWPLFNLYNINYLKADEGWLSAFSIAAGLSSILTVTYWAKLADKKSNSFVLSISTLGMSLTPILVASASTNKMMALFNIIIGISTTGTLLVLFNILLEVTPSKNRTIYMALYNTLIAISATISPSIGVYLKDKFSIYIALIIVGILRFIGSLSFFIRRKFLKNYQ